MGLTSKRLARFEGSYCSHPPCLSQSFMVWFSKFFVCWMLVKIVIDFYSIDDFLSFTVWLLDIAEVAKVNRINIFKERTKFHNFWATSMLYTLVANWDETAVKLECRKNYWEYENKQYTIEKSIENANRNAKKICKFFKICLFLGPFWKK